MKKRFLVSALPWIVGIAGLVLPIQIGPRAQAQGRGQARRQPTPIAPHGQRMENLT
jgi:hypothetical protein